VIRGTFTHPRKFYPDIVRGARRQQLLREQHEEDDRAAILALALVAAGTAAVMKSVQPQYTVACNGGDC
jgi:hypothetical protein